LPFRDVLMDSWYAEKNIMLLIDSINKHLGLTQFIL